MLGLDAAGKTTILYKLHIGEVLSTVPTIGAHWGRYPHHPRLGLAAPLRTAHQHHRWVSCPLANLCDFCVMTELLADGTIRLFREPERSTPCAQST